MKVLQAVTILLGLGFSHASGGHGNILMSSLVLPESEGHSHGHHRPPVCPDLVILPNNTFGDAALSIFNLNGPSDGICHHKQKYFFKGSDFGFDHNVCCCWPPSDAPNLQCRPKGPGVQDCPVAPPPASATETAGAYAIRVAADLISTAPANGCCPRSYIKYIIEPSWSGQATDVCMCVAQPSL